MTINYQISNTIRVLSIIIKSSLMFSMGAASSLLIGSLADTSFITVIVVWMICDITSDYLITPAMASAQRIGLKLKQEIGVTR